MGDFDFTEYRRKRRAAGKDKSRRLGDKVTTERAARKRLRPDEQESDNDECDTPRPRRDAALAADPAPVPPGDERPVRRSRKHAVGGDDGANVGD